MRGHLARTRMSLICDVLPRRQARPQQKGPMMTTLARNPSLSSSSSAPPDMKNIAQVEKEVRFAIVMYGGVSLAVYINGVAQELLHMVRSTAVSTRPGEAPQIPYDDLRR